MPVKLSEQIASPVAVAKLFNSALDAHLLWLRSLRVCLYLAAEVDIGDPASFVTRQLAF